MLTKEVVLIKKGRKPTRTDNQLVSDWLIQHRWNSSLAVGTKLCLPDFVDDAVWAALAIVAGVSNGKLNVSPKLVKKALMLKIISTEEVKRLEVGYDMSDRQAQRLAKTARFALNGIRHRIQEYENNVPEDVKLNSALERQFVKDYYDSTNSTLYSEPLAPLPDEIVQLHQDGLFLEYANALKAFRVSAVTLPSEYNKNITN